MGLFTNHRKQLRAAAGPLGLDLVEELQLRGHWREVPVSILLWTQKNDDSTSYYTTAAAYHPVPLRMSLRVTPQMSLGRMIRELAGSQDVPTGDHEFDQRFRVVARDVPRARALLGDALLRRQIAISDQLGDGQLRLLDDRVRVTRRGWDSEVEELIPMLDAVAAVTREVARVRPSVPLSDAEQTIQRSLASVAPSLGLEVDTWGLAMSGREGPIDAAARFVYDKEAWETRFEMRYPEPLGVGLRLAPQRGFWARVGDLFGAQDIVVGAPAFDGMFKVKGHPEEKVAELLAGNVAERLADLGTKASELHVHDDGIDAIANGVMADPDTLSRSYRVVAGIARAIADRAWTVGGTPYR